MQSTSYHIFFIASWLPSKHDAYEGDFILRHAQAISLYHQVSVAYIIESDVADNEEILTEEEHLGNLHIYRVYLHKKFTRFYAKQKYYEAMQTVFTKVNNIKKIDIIHANIHWRAGYSAYLLHKKYNIPYCISEHSAYFNTDYYQQNSIATYSTLKKYLVRKSLVHAAYCLPVSNYLATWMQKFDQRIRTIVVSNVVADYFAPQAISKNEHQFVFMHASMAWAEKNVNVIVAAAKLLWQERKDFALHLYIPTTNEVSITAKALPFCKVFGNVPHQEMPAAIANCDATILLSDMETQGCIILESLAMGKPVIAGAAPVFPEMITHGYNGLIAKENTSIALKNLMCNMIDNYKNFTQFDIAKDAKEKYSMAMICQQFTNVYQKILDKNNQTI
jgi:glycosyltransferase involved in cell wall biosynthesis